MNHTLRTLLPNNNTLRLFPIQRERTERNWKILFVSPLVLKDPKKPVSTKILVRTRSEEPSMTVQERLYSSLKYEISHFIPAEVFGKEMAVVMSKLQVVDPNKHEEEIVKDNGTAILKGNSSLTPLTLNSNQDALECRQKIQFTDVSYNHDKKKFAFKISYFKPSNLKNPILVLLSAPFQVFARRPKKKRSLNNEVVRKMPNKRKIIEEDAKPAKKAKPTPDEIKKEIEKFLEFFEKYQEEIQKLDEETKMRANKLLTKLTQPKVEQQKSDDYSKSLFPSFTDQFDSLQSYNYDLDFGPLFDVTQ